MYRRIGKRVLDVALVLLAAPIWVTLTVAVAVLVRITMGRPILYRQQRPGRHGVPFTIFKFRTMTDAVDPSGEVLPDEMRLTKVGALLRRTSLDELPELLNVLRGEMSLVGPRPLLLDYLPLYDERQARRHEVLPGVTGWAQVSGRNLTAWESRFEQDVWYVDNLSLRLDVMILLRTVLTVLSSRGVNQPGEATMRRFEGS